MTHGCDRFAAALSSVLIIFSTAGIVLDSAYLNNPKVESALCRFYVCANSQLIQNANTALLEPGAAAQQRAAGGFREALRRDMSYPYRWCDLGEASMLAGRIDDARYCFSRAVELAPNSPPILMRAASFHFRAGHPADALPYTSRILRLIPDYDSVIFLSYARSGLPPEKVQQEGLPDEARAVRSYFEYLLAAGASQAARQVWERMAGRKFTDDRMAGRYIEFLLHERRYQNAVETWAGYLGSRRGPYPESNLLFNGGFENQFSGTVLDWTPGRTEHVEEQRDPGVAESGKWSLRIAFDGAANVDYHGASQTVVVTPGRYRFTAAVRTANITTNRGLAFRLFDAAAPSRLDVKTEAFTGASNQWVNVTTDFTAGPGTNLVTVQLYRQPSEKFDNKIAGTAWVDSVTLRAR